LDAQPANKRGYKFNLRTTSSSSAENIKVKGKLLSGVKAQINSTKKILASGDRRNSKELAEMGPNLSLVNNFTASANGCKRPPHATLLGPLRDCLRPRIFRSNNVKNATLTKTGTMMQIKLTREETIAPSRHLCIFSATLFLSYRGYINAQ
jgi:hypothetical protein